ncbi:MAG: hypothetical protein KGH87_08175 [Thaumarchaeota archaeon]|nr:hypothetical protein [Nitrososphaerota archaeon]
MSSEQPKEINKNEDLIALLVKAQTKTSESIEKLAGDVKTLITKLGDSNPVAHGPVLEAKPKTTDEQEIGDPIKATNSYGHSQQASIIHSENPQSESDKDDLSMEHNKSSIKKEEEPKPEEKKEEEKEGMEKSKDMTKSNTSNGFNYVKVDAVRPAIFAKTFEGTPATGYQLIKAVQSGWNGKYTDADGAMSELYQRLSKGEFGMGVPGEI